MLNWICIVFLFFYLEKKRETLSSAIMKHLGFTLKTVSSAVTLWIMEDYECSYYDLNYKKNLSRIIIHYTYILYRIGIIMVYITSQTELPVLIFWPTIQGSTCSWVYVHSAIAQNMNALDDELAVASSTATTQHSTAVSSYSFYMAAVSACNAASAVHCVLGMMADFRGKLRTVTVSGGLAVKYGMSKQFET